MNYAAAFAQALNEDLDRRKVAKTGPYGVDRPDPAKVTSVRFDAEESGGYSEYTQWNEHADIIFTGPEYGCYVNVQDQSFDLGAIMERAAYIVQLPGL